MAATSTTHLYFKNWQLLLFSFFVPILILVPMVLGAREESGNLFLTLVGMAYFVCATAFFLGSAQREFMARAFTFMLPGFRRGMLRQHLSAAGALALLSLVLVLTLPVFSQVPDSPLVLGWSAAGLMLCLYGLTVLVVFLFPYSTWIPFNAVWLLFLAFHLWGDLSAGQVSTLLGQPLIWSALAAGVGWWATDSMKRPGLHRRCADQPYISIVHLKNQNKIEEFKHAQRRHKGNVEKGRRPAEALIHNTSIWTAGHWAQGHRTRALVGEALTTLMLTSIPRRRFWFVFQFLFLPLMVVGMGYYEGYQVFWSGSNMVGWFPGMAFMYAYWPSQGFHHLKTRPLGLLRARGDQWRAGWLAVLLLTLWCLTLSLITYGLFLAGDALLPDLPWPSGISLDFTTPPWHLILLPLFYIPVQLLVHTLWPMRGGPMVLQQTGTLSFFIFHGLLLWGIEPVRMAAVVIAAVAWLVLPWAWRWRVRKTDLG